MRTVNIYEAKTQLSKLLDQVAGGEAIVLARAGRPLAKLVPYREDATDRAPGCWRGRVWIAPDFDELPPELAAAFGEEAP